jgi:hypothetical protein
MSRWKLCGVVLIAACGPGTPVDTTSASGDPTGGTSLPTTSEPAPDSTSGTGASATTSGETASGGSTSGETSGTTVAAATTTTGTAETTTSTTDVEPPCVDTQGHTIAEFWPASEGDCVDPQIDWDGSHNDCIVECSTMTDVHGQGPAAGLAPMTRAAFGVAGSVCWPGLTLQRVRLGDLAVPQIELIPGLACGLDPWLGEHVLHPQLADGTELAVIMTIEGFGGDWLSVDPVDPPRLFGSLSGDLVGPFEALHCAGLDSYYDSCA